MSIYIVVDSADSIVNRIVLDDPDGWPVPEGYYIVEETDDPMAIGGSYADGVYTPPPQSDPPPPIELVPSTSQMMMYDHENRLREIEGEPPLELQDFIAKLV